MDFSPAIELIQKSKNICLSLPKELTHDVCASAEVLINFLSSYNIYVGTMKDNVIVHEAQKTIFSRLASLNHMIQEYIISLDTVSAPITQLRYEQADQNIDIILSPSRNISVQDYLSFREGNAQIDCIIFLGVPEAEIDYSHDIPAIFFNSIPSHVSDTSIAVMDTSLVSLSELIFKFIRSVHDFTLSSDDATLLLSGTLSRTGGLTNLSHTNTLLSCHEMIQYGANYETALTLSRPHLPLTLTALIGRALARSSKDEIEKISWSYVTRDDSILTQRSSRDIDAVLMRLTQEFSDMTVCVLLWQYPDTNYIRAYIAGSPDFLSLLHNYIDSIIQNSHLYIHHEYDSFSQARQVIHDLLLSVKHNIA